MMNTAERTSETHPIEVGWLSDLWPGRVGLTLAPGKQQPGGLSGAWMRSLELDLQRLRTVYGAQHLVCLLEDRELVKLVISELPQRAAANGLEFHRLPIQDGSLPAEVGAVRELVVRICSWAAAGQTTVIHCMGGLGRAGTIGGCVLRAAGLDAPATFAALLAARGVNCPETNEQRLYVQQFTAQDANCGGDELS